ncbi:MAG TPA: double-strand break repair helicase AddA [Rhizomicrobium sp.]
MSAAPVSDAADPARSAWVSAHAGTGKTYTLANRVTRLLLAGAAPQRILCLTYTKAAAAEMSGRLFAQLGRWAMLDDAKLAQSIEEIGAGRRGAEELREARRLFALALETPGGLKIRTIHAFCQHLLARFPIEAQIPPSFDVLDEQTARELIADARNHVLERAGEGEQKLAQATEFLATHSDETRLGQIVDSVLGGDRRKFEQFLERHARNEASIGAAIAHAHGVAVDDHHEDIAARFCAKMAKAGEQLEEIVHWLKGGKSTDRKISDALAAALESGAYHDFAKVFFTSEGAPRKALATNGLIAENPHLHARFKNVADGFAEAETRCRAARAAQLAISALVLAQAVHEEYSRAKRARAVLDYDDLISATLRLLEKGDAAAWVLYKLDGGLDHILIDEGQDTSEQQWRIVRRLAEEFYSGNSARSGAPRSLFVVGDEKQSIFSFQGADPAQFAINREFFEARAGSDFLSTGLTVSRRSASEILDFVDAVFAPDEVREGVSSKPIKHETARTQALGRVIFWPTVKPIDDVKPDPWQAPVDVEPKSSPVMQLASQIARRIKSWTDGRTRLPGHERPIQPGDIMVLVPRREPFASELIRQLKLGGVPVAGADRIQLNEQIAVMDLVALGRFTLLPEDDLNLAALLRSPLIEFSEEELYALAESRGSTLWNEIVSRRGEWPALESAHAFLAECRSRADFAPPFEFYAQALGPQGGRKRLLARLGAEANDSIDEFLSLALAYEQLNTLSLEGFLHWLEAGDAQIKRDMERGRDEVRVMTVHGAKGLEADIVILPDTTTIPQSSGHHGALFYAGDAVAFPVRDAEAPEQVRKAKAEADDAALREHRRLLYVALTRARDELHICGFEGRHGIKEGSWYDIMRPAAEMLGIAIKEGDDFQRADGDREMLPAIAAAVPAPAALPDWAKRAARAEGARPRLIRPSEAADEPPRVPPRMERGPQARFARGILVHALLAHLPELAPEQRERAARRYLSARGAAAEMQEALLAETFAILDDPQFAEAFAPGSRAETAIVADLPELGAGARISGRLDRVAVTDEKVLVIDFKTNRPPPERAGDVAPLYLGQMALYRAALAKLYPGRRIDCALVWTEGPRLMALPSALLDAEFARIGSRLDPAGSGS